jgi:hypothetical protein
MPTQTSVGQPRVNHCDAPVPKDTTTAVRPAAVTILPTTDSPLFPASNNRKGNGFSLSSSYVAPHCGHFSAFAAREVSDWDVCIQCRRHDSCAIRVPIESWLMFVSGLIDYTAHSYMDASMI